MDKIENFNTIHKYNAYMGVETLHPLVSVIDLSKIEPMRFKKAIYGMYGIFLKNVMCGPLRYGIQDYDYQAGTIIAIAPGQVFGVDSKDIISRPMGWALVFHPDLIYGTDLGKCIRNYSFFSYDSNEALHVSDKERSIIESCFENIRAELDHDIDEYTNTVIARSISLLLDYCTRFYSRQFITRHKANSNILNKFEKVLNDYINSDNIRLHGIPTVSYCADKLCLSPNYFGDLIKKETGKSAQEHIQHRLIDVSKELLSSSDISIAELSDKLGFKYANHFTRFFKKIVGMSPTEYRNQISA